MLNIPQDKVLHFIVGVLIAFITIVCLSVVEKVSFLTSAALANVLVFGIAGAKEIWDSKQPNHTFDGWDAYWTIAGGLLVTSALPFLKGFV